MIEKCKIRVITGEPDGSYLLTGRPDLEDFSESLMISPRLFEFGHGYEFRNNECVLYNFFFRFCMACFSTHTLFSMIG